MVKYIRVITKLPNFEKSYKGKVKTHKYINRQNRSTTENCENRNDPDLVQAFLNKWWIESDFKAHVYFPTNAFKQSNQNDEIA